MGQALEVFPPGWGLRPMAATLAAFEIRRGAVRCDERRKAEAGARRSKPIGPEIVARIHELAGQGLSIKQIGEQLGLPYMTVYRHRRGRR